jgi:hypothetical protein
MRRRRVEEPPQVLGVLAMVAFVAVEAEGPLFEDRIDTVPKRQGEAEELVVVTQPAQPVLAPPVCPRAGVVEGEVPPGVSVGRVVLADRSPGPFREVGAPPPPRQLTPVGLGQPLLFVVHAAMLPEVPPDQHLGQT